MLLYNFVPTGTSMQLAAHRLTGCGQLVGLYKNFML